MTYRTPNWVNLQEWVRRNKPDLYMRLLDCPMPEIRVILNLETGLDVAPNDDIEASSLRYLEALKSKMSKQPEALRLAEKMKSYSLSSGYAWHCHKAADELRRLHEQNQELLEALKLCEGNISSLLASKHPKVFGIWLDVVRTAIARAVIAKITKPRVNT